MEDRIIDILVSFLGDYSKQYGEWYSFNCPRCAEENLGIPDDKYNLEVNVDLSENGCGGFHCWKCGDSDDMHGTLFKLFRNYAPQNALDELRSIIDEYRESRKYEIFSDGSDEVVNLMPQPLYLPDDFKPISGNEKEASDAIDYLQFRGVDETVIKDFNIGFIGKASNDKLMRERVVIPSYDMFDTLTYWVARDYTGKSKQKVKNPKRQKTEVVFNEGRVNWYQPITLVEGPFDHIAVPNSIPLLGKSLNEDYAVFSSLKKRSRSDINIFLDDDAKKNAYRLYKMLNNDETFRDRVYIIDTPDGYDPALLYQEYGYKGVLDVMCSKHKLNEYDLNEIK
jgi:DNA primase